MVPDFKSYILLNESVSLKDFEKGNPRNLSYYDMKKGFMSKRYKYLGTIYLKYKNINIISYDEILNVVPRDLVDMLRECRSRYIEHHVNFSTIETTISDTDDIDEILSYVGKGNIEHAMSCFTKKGKMYYVFWNNDERYFYFVNISDSGYTFPVLGFFELYLKIKTSGIDAVRKEVEEIYNEYTDRRNSEINAENERKRTERENAEAHEKFVDMIRKDVQENPGNYKEVKSIPDDIRRKLSKRGVDAEYAEYIEHSDWGVYDDCTDTYYINNRDLSDGYKWTKGRVSYAKSGTYWGD